MSLVTLLVALIIVGAILYVVPMLPIDGTMKTIIKVVVIVAVLIWLLRNLAPNMMV
ncbi:MAG: hypothetical protein NUV75_05740 [Gallionella sp.]|nr:hypothetical protein [Gallionella sp.]